MKPRTQLYFLIFIAIFTTHFFAYSDWNLTYAGWASYPIYSWILYKVWVGRKHTRWECLFKKEFLSIYILHFFSLVSVALIYGDPVSKFHQLVFPWTIFLLYFFFHNYNFEEKTFIKVFITIGMITFLIQVAQILNPHTVYFGIDQERELETRNGILRYRLDVCFYFTIFCVLYFWSKFVSQRKMLYLMLFFVFFVSIYLYLARQILFVVLVTIILSSLYSSQGKNVKKALLFLALIIGYILYLKADELIEEFISKTQDDLDEDYARYGAIIFFFTAAVQSPYTILFGNGTPLIESDWSEIYGYYTVDVGIIGEFFNYGILPILVYLRIVYLILKKYSVYIPMHLKLFVLCILIDTILIHPFQAQSHAFVWISIVYMAELYIHSSKEVESNGNDIIENDNERLVEKNSDL